MHCVSSYPTPIQDCNLTMINILRDRYNVPVGYSGHETSVSPSLTAVAMGAEVVERHITLNRTMWGTDQSASLSEDGLSYLSSVLNKIHLILGSGIKKMSSNENKLLKKFKYW